MFSVTEVCSFSIRVRSSGSCSSRLVFGPHVVLLTRYLEHVADPSGHLHGCKYVLMVLSERESYGHGDL